MAVVRLLVRVSLGFCCVSHRAIGHVGARRLASRGGWADRRFVKGDVAWWTQDEHRWWLSRDEISPNQLVKVVYFPLIVLLVGPFEVKYANQALCDAKGGKGQRDG